MAMKEIRHIFIILTILRIARGQNIGFSPNANNAPTFPINRQVLGTRSDVSTWSTQPGLTGSSPTVNAGTGIANQDLRTLYPGNRVYPASVTYQGTGSGLPINGQAVGAPTVSTNQFSQNDISRSSPTSNTVTGTAGQGFGTAHPINRAISGVETSLNNQPGFSINRQAFGEGSDIPNQGNQPGFYSRSVGNEARGISNQRFGALYPAIGAASYTGRSTTNQGIQPGSSGSISIGSKGILNPGFANLYPANRATSSAGTSVNNQGVTSGFPMNGQAQIPGSYLSYQGNQLGFSGSNRIVNAAAGIPNQGFGTLYPDHRGLSSGGTSVTNQGITSGFSYNRQAQVAGSYLSNQGGQQSFSGRTSIGNGARGIPNPGFGTLYPVNRATSSAGTSVTNQDITSGFPMNGQALIAGSYLSNQRSQSGFPMLNDAAGIPNHGFGSFYPNNRALSSAGTSLTNQGITSGFPFNRQAQVAGSYLSNQGGQPSYSGRSIGNSAREIASAAAGIPNQCLGTAHPVDSAILNPGIPGFSNYRPPLSTTSDISNQYTPSGFYTQYGAGMANQGFGTLFPGSKAISSTGASVTNQPGFLNNGQALGANLITANPGSQSSFSGPLESDKLTQNSPLYRAHEIGHSLTQLMLNEDKILAIQYNGENQSAIINSSPSKQETVSEQGLTSSVFIDGVNLSNQNSSVNAGSATHDKKDTEKLLPLDSGVGSNLDNHLILPNAKLTKQGADSVNVSSVTSLEGQSTLIIQNGNSKTDKNQSSVDSDRIIMNNGTASLDQNAKNESLLSKQNSTSDLTLGNNVLNVSTNADLTNSTSLITSEKNNLSSTLIFAEQRHIESNTTTEGLFKQTTDITIDKQITVDPSSVQNQNNSSSSDSKVIDITSESM